LQFCARFSAPMANIRGLHPTLLIHPHIADAYEHCDYLSMYSPHLLHMIVSYSHLLSVLPVNSSVAD